MRKADRAKVKEPPGARDLRRLEAAKHAANVCFRPWAQVQPPVVEDNPTPFESARGFRKALEKKGFTRLGSGNFSTVLGHPSSKKVIKITHQDDNWIDYCTWGSQKGYAGTFTPKVYSFKRYPGKDGSHKFSVAVVERLKETFYGMEASRDAYVVPHLFEIATYFDNDMAKLLLEEVSPGLGVFAGDLKKGWGGQRLDLHKGNIMIREDGSVCVSDPVAGDSRMTSTSRLRTKDFTTVLLPTSADNDNEEQENCHDYRSVYS